MSTHDRDHRETKPEQGPDRGEAARASRLRITIGGGRRRGESGQAVLEFALILPFLLALVLLLLDFGKAMSYWINATQAANEGARYASVNAPGPGIDALVKNALFPELRNGSANVGPGGGATVSVCFPNGTTGVGDPVTVQIRSAYRVTILPFLGGSLTLANIPIKTTATMRLEKPATFASSGTCT